MTLREQILASEDLKPAPVEVPEWGCTVYIRAMTGAERERFEIRVAGMKSGAVPALLAATLSDAAGALIFGDPEKGAEELGGKSMAVLYRLYQRSVALNKLSPAEVDAAEKN